MKEEVLLGCAFQSSTIVPNEPCLFEQRKIIDLRKYAAYTILLNSYIYFLKQSKKPAFDH